MLYHRIELSTEIEIGEKKGTDMRSQIDADE